MNRRPVQVYWNFNRKCWSIVDARTGLVCDHSTELFLIDAKFKVSEAGRQRVLREKRKNVHARVHGTLVHEGWGKTLAAQTRVKYNPYRDSHFVTEDGQRVDFASYAAFYPDGILLCGGLFNYDNPENTVRIVGSKTRNCVASDSRPTTPSYRNNSAAFTVAGP